MRALSGLTPALSRRLQQQLLAHLPPAAARQLRRTLSLHAQPAPPAPPRAAQRQLSAGAVAAPAVTNNESTDSGTAAPQAEDKTPEPKAKSPEFKAKSPEPKAKSPELKAKSPERKAKSPEPKAKSPERKAKSSEPKVKSPDPEPSAPYPLRDELELPAPQFCTLPRLKRHSTLSRESTPPISTSTDADDRSLKPSSLAKEPGQSRGSSVRSTPDRPLLSKYLTPERNVSLDESYSSDGGSILSEPSYIAAYGAPAALGLRRHSMRLAGEQPRKRISRFLRSDFFDTPPDESIYLKHKKEKELETQKILREIREKKNKCLETSGVKSPTEAGDVQSLFKDESTYTRKCLSPISPISILTGKERSRSNTPFFPILDNIKENTLDSSLTTDTKRYTQPDEIKQKYQNEENTLNKDTRLMRPKSYPVKNIDSFDESSDNTVIDKSSSKDIEFKDKTLPRESKLIRPKSYPTSSPSPEKVFVNRNVKNDETKAITPKEEVASPATKNDVEVCFSITLPKKATKMAGSKTDTLKNSESLEKDDLKLENSKKSAENSLVVKKYQIVSSTDEDKSDVKEHKSENGSAITNGVVAENVVKSNIDDTKIKAMNNSSKNEDLKFKSTETEPTEKKGTIKKKIIKKVRSKSKTDAGSSQEGTDIKTTEKKKVTKKVKEKNTDDGTKTTTVTKKKSVLQSIGHKLEKLASTKSSSPEKVSENNITNHESKKETAKVNRMQREQSVPVSAEPPTESNLIKRAVTLTDVAALDTPTSTPSKTTVSRVLGLFKKFEPKEKAPKPSVEKSQSENLETSAEAKSEPLSESVLNNMEIEKPKRPTSLLLNGLGRKTKYGRAASDSVSAVTLDNDDEIANKKENNSKNIKNSLKLDFSRLPRVKKIVPTNPVIEPQIMNVTSDDKDSEKKEIERNGTILDDSFKIRDTAYTQNRSRSRSRSTFSNSEVKSDNSAEVKFLDRNPLSPPESISHPVRNHESTTPDKEDIVERIRRKSFYSRFNEKKQRRKSSLVGPGAAEYDPVARIHSQPTEPKFDVSPTSPVTYDLSPGYSVASDLSPSTDRYRSLLTDLPTTTRSNLRFDNYGLSDKIDTYRSLDRNEFRKYPGTRSYLDYDQPSSYTSHRYARTKSLLDSSDGTEDHSLGSLRDPHKYNRTISMYAPGSYATYRPKRTLNSAIILKESEKEPSPENILEKIRQRKKVSISITRKPDPEKDPLSRSDVSSKGEGDGAECSEKVD